MCENMNILLTSSLNMRTTLDLNRQEWLVAALTFNNEPQKMSKKFLKRNKVKLETQKDTAASLESQRAETCYPNRSNEVLHYYVSAT